MPSVNIGETPIANLDEPIAKSNSLWLTNRSFEDLEVHSRSSERPPVVSPNHRCLFSVRGGYGEMGSVVICKTPISDLDKPVSKRNALETSSLSLKRLEVSTWTIERQTVAPQDQGGLPCF